MIQIGVQTGGASDALGLKEAYRLIARSGFDAVDANLDHLMRWDFDAKKFRAPAFEGTTDGEILEAFRPWERAAKDAGLETFQAHAPFPTYAGSEEEDAFLLRILQKTIMGADSIGCHTLIIHPFFLGYDKQLSPETEWEINLARYSALIPDAKKYGVTICLENMFTGYRGRIYGACCSNLEQACRYVDTLNEIAGEKRFGFCLDTGHLLLTGQDVKTAILTLGNRIEAFHVHDNNGIQDQHLAPYMGVLDWNRFAEGLREIRYTKTICFETYQIWNVVDPALCPDMMRFIAQCGRLFARKAEGEA